jgi:deoxyribonuclease IV
MIRFGKHCSLKHGLTGALEEAKALNCEAMQIFTRSPRMWRMKPPDVEQISAFKELRRKLDIHPIIVHSPYLPNLATSKPDLYLLSKTALIDDLGICEKLEADYLVIHPGAFSDGSTLAYGIKKIASAINEAIKLVPGKVIILLENVAGGGRRIGKSFEEIKKILDEIRIKKRVGMCLDTAHALGAGYDMATSGGIDETLSKINKILGMDKLLAIHLNDSKAPLGSNRDRHEHLGKGYVGEKAFQHLISRVKDSVLAGIIETPKDSETADKENLGRLFRWRKQPVN